MEALKKPTLLVPTAGVALPEDSGVRSSQIISDFGPWAALGPRHRVYRSVSTRSVA